MKERVNLLENWEERRYTSDTKWLEVFVSVYAYRVPCIPCTAYI